MDAIEQKLVEAVHEMVKQATEETLRGKFDEHANAWLTKIDLADLGLEVDHISGLDAAIESAVEKEVESQPQDLEVDASNIKGLDTEISDVLDDWDFTTDDRLMDTVRQEVQECLDAHIKDAVADALTEVSISVENIPNFEGQANKLIQKAVKEYQQQLLQKVSPIYWFRRLSNWFLFWRSK